MTSGPVSCVPITAPPCQTSGGLPLASTPAVLALGTTMAGLLALHAVLTGTARTMPALWPTLVPILVVLTQPVPECDADCANAPVLANVTGAAPAATTTRVTHRPRLLRVLAIEFSAIRSGRPGMLMQPLPKALDFYIPFRTSASSVKIGFDMYQPGLRCVR